jgi:hypothetical protein
VECLSISMSSSVPHLEVLRSGLGYWIKCILLSAGGTIILLGQWLWCTLFTLSGPQCLQAWWKALGFQQHCVLGTLMLGKISMYRAACSRKAARPGEDGALSHSRLLPLCLPFYLLPLLQGLVISLVVFKINPSPPPPFLR